MIYQKFMSKIFSLKENKKFSYSEIILKLLSNPSIASKDGFINNMTLKCRQTQFLNQENQMQL